MAKLIVFDKEGVDPINSSSTLRSIAFTVSWIRNQRRTDQRRKVARSKLLRALARLGQRLAALDGFQFSKTNFGINPL